MEGIIQKSVKDYVEDVKAGNVIIPTFQRGKAWNNEKVTKLFLSLLYDYIVPPIIYSQKSIKTKDGIVVDKLIILDGLQRTLALLKILGGEIKFKLNDKELEKLLPEEAKLFKEKIAGKTFNELDKDIQEAFLSKTIVLRGKRFDNPYKLQRNFILLNDKPTPLNIIELLNAMYYSPLTYLAIQLSDRPEFIKVMKGKYTEKYKNKEKRFDNLKRYTRIVGLARLSKEIIEGEYSYRIFNDFLQDTYERVYKIGEGIDGGELKKRLAIMFIPIAITQYLEGIGFAFSKKYKNLGYVDVIGIYTSYLVDKYGEEVGNKIMEIIKGNLKLLKNETILDEILSVIYTIYEKRLEMFFGDMGESSFFVKLVNHPKFQENINQRNNVKYPILKERIKIVYDNLENLGI